MFKKTYSKKQLACEHKVKTKREAAPEAVFKFEGGGGGLLLLLLVVVVVVVVVVLVVAVVVPAVVVIVIGVE